MTQAQGGRLRRIVQMAMAAAIFTLIAVMPPAAQVQPGNVGGTIGNRDKSVSGETSPPRSTPKPRKAVTSTATATTTQKSKGQRCPNITGAWNSWASGMFGKGDAVFNKDGTATHRSGIPGKWRCEDGQLHIEWSDGKPGLVRLSADRKQILNASGGVHASRD